MTASCGDPELRAQLNDVREQLKAANEAASAPREKCRKLLRFRPTPSSLAEKAKQIIDGEQQVEELMDRAKEQDRKAEVSLEAAPWREVEWSEWELATASGKPSIWAVTLVARRS